MLPRSLVEQAWLWMLLSERATNIRNVILSEIRAPFLLVRLVERYQKTLDNKQEDPTKLEAYESRKRNETK